MPLLNLPGGRAVQDLPWNRVVRPDFLHEAQAALHDAQELAILRTGLDAELVPERRQQERGLQFAEQHIKRRFLGIGRQREARALHPEHFVLEAEMGAARRPRTSGHGSCGDDFAHDGESRHVK